MNAMIATMMSYWRDGLIGQQISAIDIVIFGDKEVHIETIFFVSGMRLKVYNGEYPENPSNYQRITLVGRELILPTHHIIEH